MTWADGQRTYAASDELQWFDSIPEQEWLVAPWTDLSVLYAESDNWQWVDFQDDGSRHAVEPWMDHNILFVENDSGQWVEPYVEAGSEEVLSLNRKLPFTLSVEASVYPTLVDAELAGLELTAGFTQLNAELPKIQINPVLYSVFPDSYFAAVLNAEISSLKVQAGRFDWVLRQALSGLSIDARIIDKLSANIATSLRLSLRTLTGMAFEKEKGLRLSVSASVGHTYLSSMDKNIRCMLSMQASMSHEKLASGDMKLSGPKVQASMLTGTLNSLDASFTPICVYGRLKKLPAFQATASVSLPGIQASGRVVQDQVLTLDVIIASLALKGTLQQTRSEAIILTHKRYPEWQSWHSQ